MIRAVQLVGYGVAALVLPVGAFWMATATVAEATPVGSVTPVMVCEYNNGTTPDAYSAVWGYDNTTGSTVTIAIGASNEFTPGGQNRGQPTSFSPGSFTDAFTTNWNGSTTQSWVLNGVSAPANAVVGGKPAPACASPPVSIVEPQTLLWLALGAAGAGIVVVWHRRGRRRGPLDFPAPSPS